VTEPSPRPPLRTLLESVLLVTDEPVSEAVLAAVLEVPPAEVAAALPALAQEYDAAGRGFELREVAGGWRLYTRPECAPWVERYVLDGQSARLTQAALETLAVIAYRQPVTRARISAVRGVNVDGVVRTLLSRGLVAEAGHDPDTGGALYGTTPLLLERLGLQSLDELPHLAPLLPELSELGELDEGSLDHGRRTT
jgi:segregation and condensation protein B